MLKDLCCFKPLRLSYVTFWKDAQALPGGREIEMGENAIRNLCITPN